MYTLDDVFGIKFLIPDYLIRSIGEIPKSMAEDSMYTAILSDNIRFHCLVDKDSFMSCYTWRDKVVVDTVKSRYDTAPYIYNRETWDGTEMAYFMEKAFEMYG